MTSPKNRRTIQALAVYAHALDHEHTNGEVVPCAAHRDVDLILQALGDCVSVLKVHECKTCSGRGYVDGPGGGDQTTECPACDQTRGYAALERLRAGALLS